MISISQYLPTRVVLASAFRALTADERRARREEHRREGLLREGFHAADANALLPAQPRGAAPGRLPEPYAKCSIACMLAVALFIADFS